MPALEVWGRNGYERVVTLAEVAYTVGSDAASADIVVDDPATSTGSIWFSSGLGPPGSSAIRAPATAPRSRANAWPRSAACTTANHRSYVGHTRLVFLDHIEGRGRHRAHRGCAGQHHPGGEEGADRALPSVPFAQPASVSGVAARDRRTPVRGDPGRAATPHASLRQVRHPRLTRARSVARCWPMPPWIGVRSSSPTSMCRRTTGTRMEGLDVEVLGSRYEVLRTVSEGRRASVLQALDRQLEKLVALKVYSVTSDADIDELLAEARAVQRHAARLVARRSWRFFTTSVSATSW